MVAKMVLPLFGGAPAVWNTCMVFFQATLLAGYAYAHWAPRYLGTRRHAAVHIVLMALPLFFLPLAVPETLAPSASVAPVLWLLAILCLQVGLPFFVVISTTPLLQRWFTETSHVAARDPYFLYAASNLGSVLALISYPFLWEVILPLKMHTLFWMGGYMVLMGLILLNAIILWRTPLRKGGEKESLSATHQHSTREVNWQNRFRWLLLAFVPSSLMLSVTTHLTTDVAPIPLLWVTPLALYLFTFILTFGRQTRFPLQPIRRFMPLVILLLTIILLAEATEPAWLLIPFHLVGFFIVALVCHGELAKGRPDAKHLTEFYLWLSLGGVCGGLFNALLAPLMFDHLVEYPLVLVMACLIQPSFSTGSQQPKLSFRNCLRLDLFPALAVGLFAALLIYADGRFQFTSSLADSVKSDSFSVDAITVSVGILFGIPAVLCYTLIDRPIRYGLGIGSLFLASLLYPGVHGKVLFIERTFYGIHQVTRNPQTNFRMLVHGTTVHGQQKYPDPEPLTYYHTSSPIGHILTKTTTDRKDLFLSLASVVGTGKGHSAWGISAVLEEQAVLQTIAKEPIYAKKVALIGLGVGSLAAYGKPEQEWTFYEIDPTVVWIARDSNYFSYWRTSEAKLDVVLGDARLRLAQTQEGSYDILVVDAFSSDALPLHLLTKEALAVYRSRLKDYSLVAYHISNRYVDLEPVLAELAHDAGLLCYSWNDQNKYGIKSGKFPSHWVIMGKADSPLPLIVRSGPWQKLEGGKDSRFLWTDNYSNLLSLFRWIH